MCDMEQEAAPVLKRLRFTSSVPNKDIGIVKWLWHGSQRPEDVAEAMLQTLAEIWGISPDQITTFTDSEGDSVRLKDMLRCILDGRLDQLGGLQDGALTLRAGISKAESR